MAFERPTLLTLIKRAEADVEANMPGADARFRRSNLNVLARVHAAAVHGLYGYLDWISRQILPDTAEAQILDRHAAIWLREGRLPAAYAGGSVVASGTSGSIIPGGSVIARADGVTYTSTSDVTVTGGQALVAVICDEPGQVGNTIAETEMSLLSPIAGVNAALTVSDNGISGGADIESDSALRARLIARIKQPPHGGAAHDYVAWALEVPGVTRAWVYPGEMGVGTVSVRFMRDGDADPIPGADAVAFVHAYIDERRPVAVKGLYVAAPIPTPLNFTIEALLPGSAAVRAAVDAELREMLLREAKPGGTILLSHIRAAISTAAGEIDYSLVTPVANVTHTTGQMAVMGTITWR